MENAQQAPDPGSPLDRARAHAKQRLQAQDDDLVVAIGKSIVGVRYVAAIGYEEYVGLRDAFEPGRRLPMYLDLVVKCCREVVLRGSNGWTGLHEFAQAGGTLTVGQRETLAALDVDPAKFLERHFDDVEPGTARHNALAIFAAYGDSRLVGVDVDLHAQRIDAWLGSREVDDELPPA